MRNVSPPRASVLTLSIVAVSVGCGDDGGDPPLGGDSDGFDASGGTDPGGDGDSEGDGTGGDSGGGDGSADSDGDPTSGSGDTAGTTGDSDGDPDDTPLARGLILDGIEVNQGVAIAVASDGSTIPAGNRNARLVHGRHALVRAIYTRSTQWQPAEVEGRLILQHADGTRETLTDSRWVDADADLSRLGGTFEWRLEPEQVSAGVQYAVGLYQDSPPGGSTAADPPRIPETGTEDLGVPPDLMRMEVVLVPMGGTQITDARLQNARSAYYELNPIQEVELSVRQSGGQSTDLQGCLGEIAMIRASDNPAPHVYYMGMIDGQPSGLSDLAGSSMQDASRRTSCTNASGDWAGIGSQVIVHENGHAQGSMHSPGCGAQGTDRSFPHVDTQGIARLGSWGYAILGDALYEPSGYGDIMSYCQPHWVSDYTYEAWAARIQVLSSWPQSKTWHRARPETRIEALSAVTGPDHDPQWDIYPVAVAPFGLDTFQSDPSIQVVMHMNDGATTRVPAASVALSEPGYRRIVAPLGTDAEHLDSLEVETADHQYTVDVGAARSRYARLRSPR